MARRRWQVWARVALVAAAGAAVILAQACGGGSAGVDATPTAKPLPASAPGDATPAPGELIAPPGGGAPGQLFGIGGATEEFAGFLGISQEQLEADLSAEGATPGSVAEAHGRTREELKSFFIEQVQTSLDEAVAAGTMSQEQADSLAEDLASRIDDIIEGNMRAGGAPGQLFGIGGATEEFAGFLGISQEQLEADLSAEGATPGSVAEAHGRTREELKSFFIEQMQTSLDEAVAAGSMSKEDADSMIEDLASRIDDIIDGNASFGPPGQPPAGP